MPYIRPMPIARLDSRALVRITGPDWRVFLQGLLSNDVETLNDCESRFAALLTPQGKFLFDLFVMGPIEDEGLTWGCLLDCAADRRDALIQRLSMYRLRAKVEIEPDDRAVVASWDQPSNFPDPRLPALGGRWYSLGSEPTASEDDYHDFRLSQGVPDPARDCIPDRTFPIEANFDLLHGIDFQKGCFVGQETTSRMKRRGAIKNRMLPISFDGPPPAFGAELLAGDLRAGEVLSGREGRAMALVRLDRIEGADLTVDGRTVKAETPDWFAA